MEKICARCQSVLECKPERIEECACSQVLLDTSTQAYLSNTNYDCLCNSCLHELNSIVLKAQLPENHFDRSLQEGLHYYREGQLLVFTEFYHIQKGYCCQNNCRHCAYGYAE